MFISLKIKNFRSIREPITIDMTSSTRVSHKADFPENIINDSGTPTLKSLIIYGRNASGKSNILTAFRAIDYLVTQSDKLKHGQKIPPYEPFLFDKKCFGQPVEFEITFTTVDNSVKYKFEIKFISNEIIYEALFFYPKGVQAKLFIREKNKFSFGDYYKGDKKSIQDDLLENQLFLSKSANSNIPHLKEAYLFFTTQLIVSTIHDTEYDQSLIRVFSEEILENPESAQNIKCLLKAADTNITDIMINKKNKADFQFPDNIPENILKDFIDRYKYEVKTKHLMFDKGKNIGEGILNFENESLGTKKLLAIGGLILSTLGDGGLIVIDELDKSLHPLLTKMLIGLFHNKKNNPLNAQLIFATHDVSLLDNEVFRRDQIFFVDKEYEGNTIFYRLSDIKGVRKDMPYDKWYLSGRFRAIPIISDIDLQFSHNKND